MDTQTLNISLPKDLVKKADARAKKEYKNRSELMKEALKRYLDDREEWEQIFKAGRAAMKQMGIKSEEEVNEIVYEFRHGRKSS